jgi:SAM-dependent methyltransferase
VRRPAELYDALWAETAARPRPLDERVTAAAAFVPPGGVVVDVGCGDGALAAALGSLTSAGAGPAAPGAARRVVVGVDLARAPLGAARARGVAPVQADLDGAGVPLRSGCADAVTSLDVIEHVFDPAAHVAEAFRLLRPGGRLVLTTPNTRFVGHVADLVLRGRGPRTSYDGLGWDGGHLHYFTFRDVRGLVASAGFAVEREVGVAARPYRSLKVRAFALAARLWEREAAREFLSLGILVVARRPA